MKNSIFVLKNFYFLLLVIFFFFIIIITHIVQGDIYISENIIIGEEYIESIFIVILFFVGYIVFRLYEKEIRTKEKAVVAEKERVKDFADKLNNAFKYIGRVNVQIQEIRDALAGMEKFPENKNDFRNILDFLSEKILSTVNSDWVLFRLVNAANLNTLQEKSLARGQAILLKHEISNKDLSAGRQINGCSIITSKQTNLGLKAYFIFPIKELTKEQNALIQAIAQELEMIFIIFNSKFYKKQ